MEDGWRLLDKLVDVLVMVVSVMVCWHTQHSACTFTINPSTSCTMDCAGSAHTEHAHGPAYDTSLILEFRLQLAHFILVQVLAAQWCESNTVVAGERRQVMER